MDEQAVSTLMTYILRHNPWQFGLSPVEGFVDIDSLILTINNKKIHGEVVRSDIERIVANCKKQRFLIDGDLIRARYGHSKVPMNYEASEPTTSILYHGTNTGAIGIILKEGLKTMQRRIHMSEGTDFATLAGKRRGELVLVKIAAKQAHDDGVKFFFAGGDVWLADFIPAKYLSRKEED